jgi:hypothetical protein
LVKEVPIPFNLSKNDRDRRGLPIPFIVYRDTLGVPHFTIDDVGKLNLVLAQGLCGLCGNPLQPGEMWMIGGPLSAFHAEGMYIEPPAHEECARYAIQVCPFIAASNYSRRIEAKTLKPAAIHDEARFHDNEIAPPRPPFFALTRTPVITLFPADDGSGKHHILPQRPWAVVEFWRNGAQIAQEEAETMAGEPAPGARAWWPA